jgi:hypothetical protein
MTVKQHLDDVVPNPPPRPQPKPYVFYVAFSFVAEAAVDDVVVAAAAAAATVVGGEAATVVAVTVDAPAHPDPTEPVTMEEM